MLASTLHDSVGRRMSRIWDAIVVGAGPGGAIASYALARRGASVLLLDRHAFPRWKVCGACLSAGALERLANAGLGDLARSESAVALRQLTLIAGRRRAIVPLRGSAALSRVRFDQALVDAAISEGVEFRSRTRAALGPLAGDARIVHVEIEGSEEEHTGSVVIDATGLGRGLEVRSTDPSPERLRPTWRVAEHSRVGIGATIDDAEYDLVAGDLRMVVGRTGYVGLVRLEDGRLNVGAAVDPTALRGRSPADAVADILADASLPPLEGDVVHGWRGTPALTRGRTDMGAERLFRLGDAAGYVEPFTGEGMCWALGAGLAVTELALEARRGWRPDLLRVWDSYQRKSMARSQRLCRVVAWALRRPRVVDSVVGLLNKAPLLAKPFVRQAAGAPRSRLGRAA